VWPDGYSVIYFANNDIKQVFAGGHKTVYFFAKVGTTQTTFSNGMQAFRFANNQVEKHYPNGTKEIHFQDGTVKCLYANGEEESVFPDGTKQKLEKTGL
jgi:centromere protein J